MPVENQFYVFNSMEPLRDIPSMDVIFHRIGFKRFQVLQFIHYRKTFIGAPQYELKVKTDGDIVIFRIPVKLWEQCVERYFTPVKSGMYDFQMRSLDELKKYRPDLAKAVERSDDPLQIHVLEQEQGKITFDVLNKEECIGQTYIMSHFWFNEYFKEHVPTEPSIEMKLIPHRPEEYENFRASMPHPETELRLNGVYTVRKPQNELHHQWINRKFRSYYEIRNWADGHKFLVTSKQGYHYVFTRMDNNSVLNVRIDFPSRHCFNLLTPTDGANYCKCGVTGKVVKILAPEKRFDPQAVYMAAVDNMNRQGFTPALMREIMENVQQEKAPKKMVVKKSTDKTPAVQLNIFNEADRLWAIAKLQNMEIK